MLPADLSGARADSESSLTGRLFDLNGGVTSAMQPTFDAMKDPIDLLPLRPWEVGKVRLIGVDARFAARGSVLIA